MFLTHQSSAWRAGITAGSCLKDLPMLGDRCRHAFIFLLLLFQKTEIQSFVFHSLLSLKNMYSWKLFCYTGFYQTVAIL